MVSGKAGTLAGFRPHPVSTDLLCCMDSFSLELMACVKLGQIPSRPECYSSVSAKLRWLVLFFETLAC